jgi:pyruvate carboxylase subunit B
VKYQVQVGGRLVEVVLDGETVTVDGRPVAARLVSVPGTPVRLLTLGDTVHRVVANRRGGRGAYVLSVEGWRVEVEALDERTRAIREMQRASRPTGPAPLVAPMPGLIVRVHCAVGDVVEAGQPLVVMEAMKMENELKASAGGTIRAVHGTPGQAVDKGALLVELA